MVIIKIGYMENCSICYCCNLKINKKELIQLCGSCYRKKCVVILNFDTEYTEKYIRN
jgi:hypothetical protein